MIDLRATRLLTGHYLAPVTAAEALVFPLLGHYLLCLLLHGDLPLPFLLFLSWRLVLNKEKKGYKGALLRSGKFKHGWSQDHLTSESALVQCFNCSNVGFYLWPDPQETAAVGCSTFTDSFPVAKTLQVVVEIQLRTLSTCCIRSRLRSNVWIVN